MRAHPCRVNAYRVAARPAVASSSTGLRRPLATARPGLDYLRAALVAEHDAVGTGGVGDLAAAYLQASSGTPDATCDLAAVARWAVRLQRQGPHRAASTS